VRLTNPSGVAQAPEHEEEVVGCDGVGRAVVYTLGGGAKVSLELTGDTDGPLNLLFENIDALTDRGRAERFEVCD
jgi:hypothetical protein